MTPGHRPPAANRIPASSEGQQAMSNRNRLLAVLLVSTLAIGVLAIRAASGAISYYVEPDEFLAQVAGDADSRWRVGGRVVSGTITRENGRPVSWDLVGPDGSQLSVRYDGVVPNLFTEGAFVVVEGSLDDDGQALEASSVVIKHENEFFSDPSKAVLPGATAAPGGN